MAYEDQSISEGIAKEIEAIARNFLSNGDIARTDTVAPFTHYTLYRTSIIFTDIHQRTYSRSADEAAKTINRLLNALGERWKAAGKR